jgi:hypothetical protein
MHVLALHLVSELVDRWAVGTDPIAPSTDAATESGKDL